MPHLLRHQVMKIRQMLTVVLLEVTNQEIENVAMEAIEEAKSKSSYMYMYMYKLCVHVYACTMYMYTIHTCT